MPFFERLDSAKRVLVAGAGGGFDVFAGLPIYFALRSKGVEAHLANLAIIDGFRRTRSLRSHTTIPI